MTESESDDGDSDIVERKVTGWVYVGSHNFTTAAWGSFQAKSTAFTPVFAVSLHALKPAMGLKALCWQNYRCLITNWE